MSSQKGFFDFGNNKLVLAAVLVVIVAAVALFASGTITGYQASSYGQKLTVTKAGTGAGTVTSSDGKINCGITCTAPYYTTSTYVKLTAVSSAGSTFTGWSGACSGTSTTCTVTMYSAKSVTATFKSSIAGVGTSASPTAPTSPSAPTSTQPSTSTSGSSLTAKADFGKTIDPNTVGSVAVYVYDKQGALIFQTSKATFTIGTATTTPQPTTVASKPVGATGSSYGQTYGAGTSGSQPTLTASATASGTSIKVSWNSYSSSASYAIDSKLTTADWPAAGSHNAYAGVGETSYTFNNFKAGTTYNVRVQALSPTTGQVLATSNVVTVTTGSGTTTSSGSIAPLPPPTGQAGQGALITLSKGWNLISFPGDFTSESDNCVQTISGGTSPLPPPPIPTTGYQTLPPPIPGSSSQSSSNVAIYFFDKNTQTYSNEKTLSNVKNNQADLQTGKENAFWAYVPAGCTLNFYGVTTTAGRGKIRLAEGWNFLPVTSDFVGQSLSTLGKSCDITAVYSFDAPNQKWGVSIDTNAQLSSQYKGLLVYNSNSCLLQ